MNSSMWDKEIIDYVRGELSSAAAELLEARMKREPELRERVNSLEALFSTIRKSIPQPPSFDSAAFKVKLLERITSSGSRKAAASGVTAEKRVSSRRIRVHRSSKGILGLEWRWKWVPYAISTCAIALLLLSFKFIILETKVLSSEREIAELDAEGPDLFPVRLIDDSIHPTREVPLIGRSFAMPGIGPVAYLLGDNIFDQKSSYLQVYTEKSWRRLLLNRGKEWLRNRDYVRVDITGGKITVPEQMFNKYLGTDNVGRVRIIFKGNMLANGFAEVWNPVRYGKYIKNGGYAFRRAGCGNLPSVAVARFSKKEKHNKFM